MLDNEDVIKRYRGWKARQANARARQASMQNRLEINAIRQAHYNATIDNHKALAQKAEEKAAEEAAAKEKEVSYDDISNSEMRLALADKGFDVPKQTARVRLIELYREHCVGE